MLTGTLLDEGSLREMRHEVAYTMDADLLAAWNATLQALQLGLSSEYDGNETTFHLLLDPNETLGGLTVPLEIPKCLAERASELELSGTYHIVNDDPLIVWQFDEITEPTAITFSVPKDITEECKAQLKAMAYARRIGKPLNPWLSLLLVPAIAGLLLFFQRYTKKTARQERMTKEQFREAGRAAGFPDDEIDEYWQDYQRRF